jgi:hypothetical protein
MAVNDRANLTWVLLRISEYETPGDPGYHARMWGMYDNAETLREDALAAWVAEAALALLDVIPPMPLMAPQLVHS